MIKLIIIYLLVIIKSWAFVKPESLISSQLYMEELSNLTSNNLYSLEAKSSLDQKIVESILNDKKKHIDNNFEITPYFKKSTLFWFSVYSLYSSQQVVIHDKDNLGLVYNVLDFSKIHKSEVNRFVKYQLQNDLSLEYSRKVRAALRRIHLPSKSLTLFEKEILKKVKNNIKIPNYTKSRKKLFEELASNIRTQTGQKDIIKEGIFRALPYWKTITRLFKQFDVPDEIIALAFLESSFQTEAISYVGAAGIWQFMPRTSASFMPLRSKSLDYRVSPIISTIAALHLLKQNRMILKSWELAIPAYNFGTSHFVRARRKLRKKQITLEEFFTKYSHRAVGFASENYYPSFIALVYALKYKDVIYNIEGYEQDKKMYEDSKLDIYISKCSIRPKKFYKLLNKYPHLKKLNSHFLNPNKTFKRGTILVSDVGLTSRKYFKVDRDLYKKYYPKNLYKLIKKHRCR